MEAPLQPTSELPLHLSVYVATGAAAIVHTHSPAATAIVHAGGRDTGDALYVAAFGGPVAVAPYATYGTDELAANVVAALRGRTACLMANHGAVTIGPDLATALTRSASLEWLCDVYLRAAAAGNPRLLPPPRSTAWCASSPATDSNHRRDRPAAARLITETFTVGILAAANGRGRGTATPTVTWISAPGRIPESGHPGRVLDPHDLGRRHQREFSPVPARRTARRGAAGRDAARRLREHRARPEG